MSTWILILTIVSGDYRGGYAVSQVGPFASQASCMTAADAWIKAAPSPGRNTELAYRALCVRSSER